jgi:SAM-dependent methyltransferase
MPRKAQPESPSATTCWSGRVRAERYDRDGNRSFYRRALAHVLEEAPNLSGQGLDLGCGTGFSTELLVERFPRLAWHGADCSNAMLALARDKPGLRRVTFHEARAEALPFPSSTFDVVVASFAWHWFGDGAGAEIRRVLRPGGWVLAGVPLRRPSRASGNRALARVLMAGREHFVRKPSQGLRFDEARGVLPGPVRIARHELIVETEQFSDGKVLLDALDSRGALAAIFGAHPPLAIEATGPLIFEWPFAVLHAQV